jgi:hypothetical protein
MLFSGALLVGKTGMTVYRDVQALRDWSSTEGQILSGTMTSRRERTGRLTRRYSDQDRRYRYRYSSQIACSYTVDGEEYVSTQISLAKNFDARFSTFSGRTDAAYEATWLAKYPVGKTVPVYYDPDDPANAVLERDEVWLAYLFFAVAGVLAIAGLSVLNALRHSGKEHCA